MIRQNDQKVKEFILERPTGCEVRFLETQLFGQLIAVINIPNLERE